MTTFHSPKSLFVLTIALVLATAGSAQPVAVPKGLAGPPETQAPVMAALAVEAIGTLPDGDPDGRLNMLFRLQMVAGRFSEVPVTLRQLRNLRRPEGRVRADSSYVQYEIFARARELERSKKLPFATALNESFRSLVAPLDDETANEVSFSFGGNVAGMREDFERALQKVCARPEADRADVVDMLRKYQVYEAYRQLMPLTGALLAEDEARRYEINEAMIIDTGNGKTISAMLVRPLAAKKPVPTLLNFTIYVDHDWKMRDAKTTASHGYAAVIAYTRGKGHSSMEPVPYEHDGEDADGVIRWISRQPWSDGRVGMYGGSYEGFTAWAAAKHEPVALKAIMASAAVAPGIDVPMEGNVFQSFVYSWLPYVTNNRTLDEAVYGDHQRWDGLNSKWYSTGASYRSLEQIDGHPSPFFRRWLDHPSYDQYWQKMMPYRKDFASIDIPVLSTTGYYDGGEVSTLFYLKEHTHYRPGAEHYLVIGPYDHIGAQVRSAPVLLGYEIDPDAAMDFVGLRYQWFDYVLKGGPKPAILKDRINYEVMGANTWKHARSLEAVANGTIRYYLNADLKEGEFLLAPSRIRCSASFEQTVNLSDRTDLASAPAGPTPVLGPALDSRNGLIFRSEPFGKATEISGLFSGSLAFVINKRDVDLNVALYEQTSTGQYFQLAYWMGRASYVADRAHRRLLEAGQLQQLKFTAGRMTSRQLAAGSRLVTVLSVLKQPDVQINYGTGRDVSDESIKDAGTPLKIIWDGESYFDIPTWTEAHP